jgi:hypothetical protein
VDTMVLTGSELMLDRHVSTHYHAALLALVLRSPPPEHCTCCTSSRAARSHAVPLYSKWQAVLIRHSHIDVQISGIRPNDVFGQRVKNNILHESGHHVKIDVSPSKKSHLGRIQSMV